MSGVGLTKDVRFLMSMKRLKVLNLRFCKNLHYVKVLAKLPALVDLDVTGCYQIDDLKHLGASKSLHTLRCTNSQYEGEWCDASGLLSDVLYVAAHAKLKSIHIGDGDERQGDRLKQLLRVHGH